MKLLWRTSVQSCHFWRLLKKLLQQQTRGKRSIKGEVSHGGRFSRFWSPFGPKVWLVWFWTCQLTQEHLLTSRRIVVIATCRTSRCTNPTLEERLVWTEASVLQVNPPRQHKRRHLCRISCFSWNRKRCFGWFNFRGWWRVRWNVPTGCW